MRNKPSDLRGFVGLLHFHVVVASNFRAVSNVLRLLDALLCGADQCGGQGTGEKVRCASLALELEV